MIVADTSVAVAAALPWHESHSAAVAALPARSPLLAQVGIETYSVLTRLPPPQRVPPDLAHAYLLQTFSSPPIVLAASDLGRLLERAAAERIVGGAIYDALVAATAREAGATLITLDRRAIPTYQRLGVAYTAIV